MKQGIEQAKDTLRRYFGFGEFRAGQGELIGAVLEGRDCLGVMPTGAGKSICYQVPALMLPGVTLVISPLVSLMQDQVGALVNAGVPAACLNSQLLRHEREEAMWRAASGECKLLYVAPERLDDQGFCEFARGLEIPLVAVDEAHCVSQWGQDFRPSYLRIGAFIESLAARPVVAAFTATATPRVADDIARLLGLRAAFSVTTGFDRPNLRFAVEQVPERRKGARLLEVVRGSALGAGRAAERGAGAAGAAGRGAGAADVAESGIVYCSTRKNVEAVHEFLVGEGVAATRYHAGLSAREREANQRAFVNDDAPVIVATNAFGMGIDKSNVRYVVHYNMPGSMEEYYQEAGRAGRDGEPAECLLMWNDSDIATARFFIEQDSGNEALTPEEADAVRAGQRRRLAAMTGYCLTTECLRGTILRYFGDEMGDAGGEIDGVGAGAGAGTAGATDAGTGGATSDVGAGAAGVVGSPGAAIAGGATNDVGAGAAGTGAVGAGLAGARAGAVSRCGNCSNCDEGAVAAVDVTATARAVMRCVQELRGRFGKGTVADVLTGSRNAKLLEWGLDRKRTYGTVDESAATVKEVIELLTAGGYLDITEGKFPLVGFGPRYREAAEDGFRLFMKRRARKTSGGAGGARELRASRPAAAALETEEQRELFERLRRLRKRIADEDGVPPYVVFSDAALRGMCVAKPANDDEFLAVNGVGQVKLQRYGAAFLSEINQRDPQGGTLNV